MPHLPVPSGGATLPAARIVEAVEAAVEFQYAAKAESTRRAYAGDWAHFTGWCAAADVPALPAEPGTLAAYLSAMAREGYAAATIERRRAAVTHHHEAARLASPSYDPFVAEVMQGILRTIGTRQTQKAPLTDVELRRICKLLPGTLAGLRDRALLLVGFAGGLRRSELAPIILRDVERAPGGLIIHLGRTKGNQQGADEVAGVPTGRHLKPVEALDAWLAAAGIVDGPLFRPVDRHGNVGAEKITPQSVGLVVKRVCALAKLDPALFGGHSLRAGLVTAALGNGVDLFTVMDAARHKDPRTTKVYDRRDKVLANHAARKLL